ncbi:helix-turn-helix transcriptional regulator [Halomonas organivorans]|uniref:AraC-like DNA-binding protein n=1 Tax=Halomonas organivorans TaxID=257772 RepID=A0A7W5G714_9GAMM|nr:AraC family transcriptional regulator [Halomonas organivorans]MBB3142056.1 AraC-like DNA-binding protein [Halomonas organivorans]
MCQDMMRAEIWLQETLDSQQGIEELATRMGYSSSQIRRRFRKRFGVSPGTYRDQLRLEKAARLLIHTPQNISHIAAVCGYRNHSAFSRAFQRYYGDTPRHYRQRLRLTLQRQCSDSTTFSYRIRELPRRQAVLTRLYHPQPLENLHGWQRHTWGAEDLPSALNQASPLAVFHDQPIAGALPRLDLGVAVDDTTSHLALPPTFRLQNLPARRLACITLDSTQQVDSAVLDLACRSLAGSGAPLNGEAPQLLQEHGVLELRIPLL